jgi:hypothetical protein
LFIAAPCLAAIIPTSYYTHLFSKDVNKLEKTIAAPDKIKTPTLHLPVYDRHRDLDLLQTRLDTQNRLSKMSLKQVFDSKIPQDNIVGYQLLGDAAHISKENRSLFYGKCVQLLDAHQQIDQERLQYIDTAEAEYKKLDSELRDWRRDRDEFHRYQELERERRIRDIQANIHLQRLKTNRIHSIQTFPVTPNRAPVYTPIYAPVRRPNPVYSIYYPYSTYSPQIMTEIELKYEKIQVAEKFGRRDAENQFWLKNIIATINREYEQAAATLEMQYIEAKKVAIL